MSYLRSFIRFWIDFIVGDAWEVAATIAATLGIVWFVIDRFGGASVFGYILVVAIFAVTWLALLRATRSKRR
jgi:hypothetical protein